MLSPSTAEGECNCSCMCICSNNTLNNINNSSSSTSSSSLTRLSSLSSSSITPSFSYPQQQTPRRNNSDDNNNMEDVWKDINLVSLTDQSSTHIHHRPIINTTPSSNLQGVNFHDFLTPPLTFTIAIDPPTNTPTTTTVSSKTTTSSISSSSSSLTSLSLNSHPQMFHFVDPLGRHHHPYPYPAASSSKVDPLSSNLFQNSLPSSLGNKRSLQSDMGNSRDRRNKRMMKNRESAARSRARKQENIASIYFLSISISLNPTLKFMNTWVFSIGFLSLSNISLFLFVQAYTHELKRKVKHLEEENARLRRQHQQWCYTAANQQQKKRGNLYRTSTAPF